MKSSKFTQLMTTDKFLPNPHLLPLWNLIKFKSVQKGYCYCWLKTIAELLKIRMSTLKHNLKKLEVDGWIFRERYGRRVLIWTPENFVQRSQILAENPPASIGRTKYFGILEFCDPKYSQILSTKTKVFDPIVLGQKTEVNGTIRGTIRGTNQPTKNTPILSLSPYIVNARVLNYTNSTKEEVVIISKKNPTKKHRPKASASPLFFQRDFSKEQASQDGRKKLYTSYSKEEADKRIATATNFIAKLASQGRFHLKEYQMGVDGLALLYCEINQRKNSERAEREKIKEPRAEMNWDQIIENRRRNAKNDYLIIKLGTINESGIIIDYNKIGLDVWNKLSITGISFDNPEFDTAFKTLVYELKSIRRSGVTL